LAAQGNYINLYLYDFDDKSKKFTGKSKQLVYYKNDRSSLESEKAVFELELILNVYVAGWIEKNKIAVVKNDLDALLTLP
jgi:hypothetical protein